MDWPQPEQSKPLNQITVSEFWILEDGKVEDMENRNVIPIFGHSSLEIPNFGRAVFWILVDIIGSEGSKRKTSEVGHRAGRRGRGTFRRWFRGFRKTAEEESGNWSFRVYVYVVEFRLFFDLTYMCVCVCDICIRVRGSVFEFSPTAYILELFR